MKWEFKENHPFEVRCAESAKIRGKYQDRIPVGSNYSMRTLYVLVLTHSTKWCLKYRFSCCSSPHQRHK